MKFDFMKTKWKAENTAIETEICLPCKSLKRLKECQRTFLLMAPIHHLNETWMIKGTRVEAIPNRVKNRWRKFWLLKVRLVRYL